MAKKDFDIDFDFDEAYGFDAKSFSDDAAFDDNADAVDFSDKELGLASDETASDGDAFDLDGDLDDFLNMGNEYDARSDQGWMESEQDDWQGEEALETDAEIPGQYAGEEGYDEEPAYDEEALAGYDGEYDEAYDGEGEEEVPQKEKKPRKPIKLPKLPKLKTWEKGKEVPVLSLFGENLIFLKKVEKRA